MRITLIVAMTRDRLIGRGGGLPWHVPEDLKHFKQATMGRAIVMGRRTYDSVGKPLPGRRNIVVTRNPAVVKVGVAPPAAETTLDVVDSLDGALDLCRQRGEDVVCIVGGAQIYEEALPRADEMIVTYIDEPGVTGDTYFPAWNDAEWRAEPYPHEGSLEIVRYSRVR